MLSAALPAHPDLSIEAEHRVWNGRFPLDVIDVRSRRFDGSPSGPRRWELWRRSHAAARLPCDPIADAVVPIEQCRLPALAAGFPPVPVELPAGLCGAAETPEPTIRRKAEEKMGLVLDRLLPIDEVVLSRGGSDERCARSAGPVRSAHAGADGMPGTAGPPAEEEDIRVRRRVAPEGIAAALDGRFPNALTMRAPLRLASRREVLRTAWSDR